MALVDSFILSIQTFCHYVPTEDGLLSAQRTSEALFKKDINALAKLSESEINDVFEGAATSKLFFTPEEMTALDLGLKTKCFQNECMSHLYLI